MMAHLLQTLALISVISLTFPLHAYAHMEMRWPYAFRSKYNPAVTDPDYDNTSPLRNDGSDYPCKGYHTLPGSHTPSITYTPGDTYNITLAGTANHMGGSCQLSLSYDNGQTFRVIKSMMGGCPLKLDWDFVVPSDAPSSGNALLAWTWFNLVGNREMYMNCARVGIAGQPVQRYRRYQTKRQTSLNSLPEDFACNIGNGCKTIERRAVDLPNPGSVVERNADAVVPDPGPFFTLNSTPTGNAFSSVTTMPIAITVPYPVTNTTNSALTSSRLVGNATNGVIFSTTVENEDLSTTSLSSTSSLTVTSSLISTTTTTMTTTISASPAFFYSDNATNSPTLPTSTTATPTTFTPYSSITTTYVPFANTTSDLVAYSTSLTDTNETTSTATTMTSTIMFYQNSTTSTASLASSLATTTSTEPTNLVSPTTASAGLSTTTSISSTLSTVQTTTPVLTTTTGLTSSSSILTTTAATLSSLLSTASTTSSLTSSTLTTSIVSTALSTSTSPSSVLTTSTASTRTSTTITTSTTSTTSTSPTATIIATSCSPGSFTCNSTTTFSQCVSNGLGSGTYVFMGSVAGGTQCVDGTIVRQNAGPCTPNGSLQCDGETAFYICDEGGLISMGSVASGTACRNGTIGFA